MSRPLNNDIPYITGGNLSSVDVFKLVHFKFRWGYNIYQGSEHQIDGQKFPLEVIH